MDWFANLSDQDSRVIFAALWAALDVHAPVDNLSEAEWERLEQLANIMNVDNNIQGKVQ